MRRIASDTNANRGTRFTGRAQEILSRVKISEVYAGLVGEKLRRTGQDRWRGVAVWRGGNGFNVSLDDGGGRWHDFVTGEGGGVLDLILRVRGGSRQDALRWVAELVGYALDDRPSSASERARWAREHSRVQIELPRARLWRRAVTALGEAVLDEMKAGLGNPRLPMPEIGEVRAWTAQVGAWRRLDGASLVDEYLWWAEHEAHLTSALLYAAALLETAEHRALSAHLGLPSAKVGL